MRMYSSLAVAGVIMLGCAIQSAKAGDTWPTFQGPRVGELKASQLPLSWSPAENIAWHSLSSMSPDTAAATLHDMWVNSPGHYRNMLDPRWTRVGIGFHVDGSGWYGTHMFAD